jgi:hypothetical protein
MMPSPFMMRRITLLIAALLLHAGPAFGQDDAETFFELKIRPILAGTCFPCHGGKKTSAGLRVNTREALLKGGDRGPALVPGDPENSLLIAAIRHEDEDLKMPPDKRLPDAVIADLTDWVTRGAVWPKTNSNAESAFATQRHWAFEPVRAIDPPPDPSGWAEHPIDRFLAAQWRKQELHPVALADPRTLIRRITFDLIGLPPTPEEIADFLADQSADAYNHLVDRLLASPHYGERWGRHWMDVARYADTAGDNADYPIPEVRLYRDYIIDAFNHDKPYDQFVQEQLAGDLLALQGPRSEYAERVIATGFLALSRKYATAPEELWHLTLEDTIETTGRAFLGLTLRCARCHDHKFDPVTQEDYYALYGIFASTQFPYAGSEEFASKGFPRAHFAPLVPPDEARSRLASYQQEIEQLKAALQSAEKENDLSSLNAQIETLAQATRSLELIGQTPLPFQGQLARLRKRRDEANAQHQTKLKVLRDRLAQLQRPGLPPDLPGAYAVHDKQAVDEAIQLKGEPNQRGKVVKRGVPKFLAGREPPQIPDHASGRLELAQWITRPDHPLTARVMVNRIWQHHFGRGIVATPSNFGLRGEEPTHPELLDWLAARFIDEGWSIKTMHRLILTSKAYQLSSLDDPHNAALDPANRTFWHFERRRLDAEAIRDAMLAIADHLDRSRPGPHPFPPMASWGWTQHNPFKAVYSSNRRSVYLMTQRLQRHPYLGLFDGPDTNHSTDVRSAATVPLQALYLMNDPFVAEQAEGLAHRLLASSNDDRTRITLAHELAWGRPPRAEELDNGSEYLQRYAEALSHAGGPADRIVLEAWTSYARILLTANEFFYID